jgi:hypothetical protein
MDGDCEIDGEVSEGSGVSRRRSAVFPLIIKIPTTWKGRNGVEARL